MIEVMMHDVLRLDFERWLESRGLMLAQFPGDLQEEERGTTQYFVTLSSERAREAFGGDPT